MNLTKQQAAVELQEKKLKALDEEKARIAADLKKAKDQLKSFNALQAAKQAEAERKLETRRSILKGAAVTAAVKSGDLDAAVLAKILDKHLIRDVDRKLMDLSVADKGADKALSAEYDSLNMTL